MASRVLTLVQGPKGDQVVSTREQLPAAVLVAVEKNGQAIIAAAPLVRCRCLQGVETEITAVSASLTEPGVFFVRVERSDACASQAREVRVDRKGRVLKGD